MIILHMSWHDGAPVLWGERTADCQPVERSFVRSPFDVPSDGLRQAISDVLPHAETIAGQEASLELLLPSEREGAGEWPIPSQSFLSEGLASCAKKKNLKAAAERFWRTWRVTGWAPEWRTWFALLGKCREARLAEGVFAANDLLAFAEFFRYVGALVARGRFLPGIRRQPDGGYEAWWLPTWDLEERRRFDRLARRFPTSARIGQTAQEMAEGFARLALDHLARVSVVTPLSRAQAERGRLYSAHDAWFSALRGEKREIRWENNDDLAALAKQLDLWARPVSGSAPGDGGLSFQLQEPEDGLSPDWRLLANLGDGPLNEGHLLALGQAAQLFPALGGAERDGEKLICRLTALDAHRFLKETGPLLAAAGFDVVLPAWWQPGRQRGFSLEASVAPSAEGLAPDRAANELVDVRWAVMFNGERVEPEEVEPLLQADAPLVLFRGRWIQVDPREAQSILRLCRRPPEERQTALEAARWSLGAAPTRHGLPVTAVRGAGWFEQILAGLNSGVAGPLPPVSAPESFVGTLRPYQLRGYAWLIQLREWGLGACLADDMGLGKTVQALAFLLAEQARGVKRPALVVAPMSALGNWLREASRFAPALRCLLHHGPLRREADPFVAEAMRNDVVITSYHLLYRDYGSLRRIEWSVVILDEAQNIKNPETRQAQAARALQAGQRIALTGTPMENHVGEIWSLMEFLNPGLLGRRSTFRELFFQPIQSGSDPGARARLRRITAPFILRRLKTDRQIIADLPDKTTSKVYCPLTNEQVRLYQEVLDGFSREMESASGMTRRGLILATLTRLKQVCNHPAHYLGEPEAEARRSGKLRRLDEMLEEVFAQNGDALVFTQYAAMGALLRTHLCERFGRSMPFLHGALSRLERERQIQAFQESDQPRAFILSLKAGGMGLNLTRANHVFHFDRWWNPAVENQATDRAYRIGQTRNVIAHAFICGGTLEERIDAMIESKTALADEIVASGETALASLPDEELRECLRLDSTLDVWDEG